MPLTKHLPYYKNGPFVAEMIHGYLFFGFKEVLQELGQGNILPVETAKE